MAARPACWRRQALCTAVSLLFLARLAAADSPPPAPPRPSPPPGPPPRPVVVLPQLAVGTPVAGTLAKNSLDKFAVPPGQCAGQCAPACCCARRHAAAAAASPRARARRSQARRRPASTRGAAPPRLRRRGLR
jgi:hypothetical protein